MEKDKEEFRKYRQKRRGKRSKTFSGIRNQAKSLKLDDVVATNIDVPMHLDNANSGESEPITAPPNYDISSTSPVDFVASASAISVINENDEDWCDIGIVDDDGVVREEPVSQRKIKKINVKKREELTGYRFIDISILKTVFQNMICPKCNRDGLLLQEGLKRGLAFKYTVSCVDDICCYSHSFFNSPKTRKNNSRFTRSFDINPRTIYSMRRLGKGFAGLKKLCYLMNHPPPMSEKSFRETNYKIYDAIKAVCDTSLTDAAEEVKTVNSIQDGYCHTSVSVDGTWQRRGYSSLHGAVVAMSMQSGKVLDIAMMSRYCQGCTNINAQAKSSKFTPSEIEMLRADHDCMINHHGSAPAMETKGAIQIFNRSKEKGLIYSGYYGDGDSKAYGSVKEIYPGIPVIKYECVGHVQKRVGCRLRKLKKNVKGLSELTGNVIDRLQNYFGIAIRTNVNDLEGMKKAVAAVLFHVASSKEKKWHTHCPDGANSWCRYKKDEALGTSTFVHGKGLSLNVIKHTKPVFEDLSKDSLLSKCLHGKTQNQNESFNSTVWKRVPKDTFVGAKTFALGAMDAVAHFNDGNIATLNVLDEIGLFRGHYTTVGCHHRNEERCDNAIRKSDEGYRKRRKFIRGTKKSGVDKQKKSEGVLYGPGKFVLE